MPIARDTASRGTTHTVQVGKETGLGVETPQIRVPAKLTCRGCPATWTGLGRAHCSAPHCHRTFTSVTGFDRHRRRDGSCHHPANVGLVQRPDGLWSAPAPDPTQRDMAWRNR